MIEKGDSYFSNCRLTEIGKEYATKGMKFKTTNSQEFSLYFDLTTNQHKKAKEVFQDLKANKIYSPIININFNDESFLKSFAESQIPDIYSEANCNSFANSKLISVSNFSFDLDAGIIYDFQLNSYSLKIYSEHAKNEYFTQVVNLYDELKNQAIQHFFSKLNPTNFTKKEIQINYEEEICGVQSDAEYLQYQNKPQDAFDIVKKYQKESAICEHIHFWQNLNEILSENITEVYFNIPEICENHKKALQNLSKLRPGLSIFITTPKADVSVTFENLFSMNNFTNANYFCCFTKEWFYYVYFYIIPYDTRSYSINVIGKIEANTRSNDISENLKLLFAEKYIPILLTEANQILDSQFDNYFTGINCAKEADKKLKQFQSYSNVLGLTPHFELLEIKKQAKIEQIKTQHKELLLQKLDAFKNETDFEKIEKLDQILKIKSQLEIIEKECFDDYFDLLKSIQSIKKTVTEQELYIKDQLLAKHYIIDTNVFVDCPEILSKIDIKHNVVLSARVIDELDKLKIKLKGEARENAEKSLKLINQKLGKKKNIKTARADLRLLPVDFNDKSPDNLILCVALMYKDKNPFLLTSDNGLQAKAKICDIPTLSLADFLFPKINNKGNVLSLPINNRTGELISLELILKAYKDASLNQKSETIDISIFSVKLRELSNRTFFHQEYGFKQFKDFCNSLTFLFDITKNEAGNGYITLKKVK